MQFSHSRVELFNQCPYKYKLRHIDKLEVLPSDDPANALYLGQALHTGLEKGVEEAVKQYFSFYPVITDNHINEAMKLEYLIPKATQLLPKCAESEFEKEISCNDFIGFLDFLYPISETDYALYDFKYSSNGNKYQTSPQLHIYKYFFEKLNHNKRISEMFYLIVPKTKIRQKKTESLEQFRIRLNDELNKIEPHLMPIEYDFNKVAEFLIGIKNCLEETEFTKNPSYLCNWCDYQTYCEKGLDYMILPKNERRNIETANKRTLWIYGAPFSGKTTFANQFPDPLMLNTDGNIAFVDAPYMPIKNDVKVEGRITKTTLAWDIFKQTIAELEKKDNSFKTIIVDLIEDLYEHCRIYMYEQMGITHESDDSFRAWDKVRIEFLSTVKRLMNLDYENIILISHEDTSKDITRKGGDKITAIKPNIQEKTANKIAGMVHIVARIIADGDVRTLSFKQSEVTFGGGRLTALRNEIPLNYDDLCSIFDEASKNAVKTMRKSNSSTVKKVEQTEPKQVEPAETEPAKTAEEPASEPKRTRKRRV
jgi:phage nucleotide-binding protein